MFAEKLQVVIVDVGRSRRIRAGELHLLHLVKAQVLVAPAAAAEDGVLLEKLDGDARLVVVLARGTVEQAGSGNRAEFARHVPVRQGRVVLALRRKDHADDQQDGRAHETENRTLDLACPIHACKQHPEDMVQERKTRDCQRHDDGRAAEREQHGEEVERHGHERVVGADEAQKQPLAGDLRLGRLGLRLHLPNARHPHAERQRERQHEEAARLVRIAERREEVRIGPHVNNPRSAAKRDDEGIVFRLVPHHHELRARGALHESEHRKRGGVPHEHLHQHALAVAQERVPRRQHRGERRQEPHQHLEMVAEVHAERDERDWRGRGQIVADHPELPALLRGEGLQNRVKVARGAQPLVQEGDAEHHDEEKEREEEHRVAPDAPPAPLTGLHGVLAGVPLREADQNLEDEREQPRHRGHEQVAVRAAAYPGQRGQRREDEQYRYRAEKCVHGGVILACRFSSDSSRACRAPSRPRRCSRPGAS